MLKNVFFAAVAAGLIAAVTLLVQITPVEAGTVTCNAGGEVEVPKGLKERHAYGKACKAAWKAQQA